ncbi:protein LTV1-like [Carica papaya]|uniref:protein LTV1-like n=1 Tax=Carica papaya TaxID=3649 RepID=UPI000B8CB8EE|nr:protein LTV1-like [Carica papaya]
MGKKKFIDKKKAATFQLLARDSSDPNYNDSSGSDRIFVRVDNGNISVNSFFNDDGDDGNAIFSDAPEDNDGGNDDDRVFGNSTAFNGGIAGPGNGTGLPEHVRREILELGFPDDGYNYLIHLREIKNTGGGSAFYHNPKARLDQLPHDVKAYDASRLQISHVKGDSDEKSIYGVASGAVNVRVQKAVDPDVTALLDDSDLSRFGSDVEDLEEDFVVQANLPEEGGKDLDIRNKLTLVEELEATNEVDYPTFSRHDNAFRLVDLDEEKKQSTSAGDNFASEKTRVHRLLDEQFDLVRLLSTDKKEIKDVCSLKIEPLKRKPRGQESKDEKRERKAAVREKRREALRIKKETSELYKETARHAQRVAAISGPSSIHLM